MPFALRCAVHTTHPHLRMVMGTHVPKKAQAQMINASEIPRADAKMRVSLAGTARTHYREERERVSCAQGVETILRTACEARTATVHCDLLVYTFKLPNPLSRSAAHTHNTLKCTIVCAVVGVV